MILFVSAASVRIASSYQKCREWCRAVYLFMQLQLVDLLSLHIA
jgi:hypothetical protein